MEALSSDEEEEKVEGQRGVGGDPLAFQSKPKQKKKPPAPKRKKKKPPAPPVVEGEREEGMGTEADDVTDFEEKDDDKFIAEMGGEVDEEKQSMGHLTESSASDEEGEAVDSSSDEEAEEEVTEPWFAVASPPTMRPGMIVRTTGSSA